MLHLQVTSLRRGMWDSIYDNFQMTSLSDTTNTGSGNQVGEINPIENSELSKTQHVMPPTHCEYIYVLYLHLCSLHVNFGNCCFKHLFKLWSSYKVAS